MVETDLNTLRNMSDGFIRFSIRANDTEPNQEIHNAFKEIAKVEFDNNYTLTLKHLIEQYQHSNQIEALWAEIAELKERLDKPKIEEEKETEGAF